YVAGEPSCFDGAIIQDNFSPAEPMGFGLNAEVLWDLLKSVEGWDCVNVASACAIALGKIIEKKMGVHVRYYGDVYHVLSKPVLNLQSDVVRQLTIDDLNLLESAPAEVQGAGFGSIRNLLSDGIVACAIVSGNVVSIAHTSARTEHYADIGVFTLEKWRGKGFATAAAAIVARRVQEAGQTPTWSAGEDNFASLRVAQKLGFTEVSRRTYLIPNN
ncbi:MAG: GNAT family N-acetyltransferase, partial [Candidatus Poribacteria bacterium]